jgi:hypothetical protein
MASLAADPMWSQSDREPGVPVHDGQKARIPGQRHDPNKCTLQVDSIVEHPDIISEGESRATDEASTEAEESFAPPEEDRAEGEV